MTEYCCETMVLRNERVKVELYCVLGRGHKSDHVWKAKYPVKTSNEAGF